MPRYDALGSAREQIADDLMGIDKPAHEESSDDRWATIKDRLAIVMVIVVLLIFGFMMVDGAVINFQCSFFDFITFKCNRWDAGFKPWQ